MAAWSQEPAQWGRDDCALEIANIDMAVLGTDPAKDWRSKYHSEAEAKTLLGKRGIAGMAARIARSSGWKRIEPRAAQDGDRAIGITFGGLTCLIRLRGFWVGRAHYGNWLVGDQAIVKAWSIV